jgi:lipopolysaccharide biosynthesis protein
MEKSIICHFFYPEISQKLLHSLMQIDDNKTLFLINIQGDTYEHESLVNDVKQKLNNVKILKISDKGRDIGAKLFLINLLLELKIDSAYTLIIHDKKSSHLESGSFWRDELFKIIAPGYISKVIETFERKPEIGIIAASKFIQNEYLENSDSFACNCSQLIKELLKRYQINPLNYDFVAGNIFWIRTNLLQSFFKNRSIAKIRGELEMGNIMDFNKGTYVHSWERIISWIASSQGHTLYGF